MEGDRKTRTHKLIDGPIGGLFWRLDDEHPEELFVGFAGAPSWRVTVFAPDIDSAAYAADYARIGVYSRCDGGYAWKRWL